jgi:hypothetical protein
MVQMLGSVEDERHFSSLAFCKSRLCNQLNTNLALVIIMFSHKFYTMHNFSYVFEYDEWWAEHPLYDVGS